MKVVEIEASGRCNTHCLHCPRDAITRPLGLMTWDAFETISGKLLASGEFEAVAFSGMGEPTLNPLLPRFVSAFADKLAVSLTTNASTLSPERIEALLGAGLDSVYVSFSGHDAGLYERMMGGLDFDRASQRIRDLARIAAGRARVSANVSVTPLTRPHLAQIKAHLESLGIQEMLFAMCHNRGGYLGDPCICDTPLPPAGAGRCDIFADTLYLAWNGDVLACCHDLEGMGRIGNLAEEQLDTILSKKERMVGEGVRFPMCATCNDMYRFASDPTPDRRPLSEWVYTLASGEREDELLRVIQTQEKRIDELESRLATYERNYVVRLARWVERVVGRWREGA